MSRGFKIKNSINIVKQVRNRKKLIELFKVDNKNLAHTKWNYKYHIMFVYKHIKQIIWIKIKINTNKIMSVQENLYIL